MKPVRTFEPKSIINYLFFIKNPLTLKSQKRFWWGQHIILNYFLFYVYECLTECVYVYYMCACCPVRTEEDIRLPRAGSTYSYENLKRAGIEHGSSTRATSTLSC